MPPHSSKAARTAGGRPAASDHSYEAMKEFEGKRYTGMRVGRSHTWKYDAGAWRERKATPDEWTFTFEVKKRRAGKAPEGSGVPVGTEYHWFVLADQFVRKLDANTYSTAMRGLKVKLAHKRAASSKWSATERAQRRHLVAALKHMILQLEGDELREVAPAARGNDSRRRAAIAGERRA